jgi:hypothetical protein
LSEQQTRAARRITSTSSLGTALAGAVRPAVVPHGFTLAMWGAGMLAVGTVGPPRGIEVALCVAAALAGSWVIAGGAAWLLPRRNPGDPVTGLRTPALPVALSLLVSALIVHTTSGPLTWALLGVAVTTTYFLALAGQLLLLARFRGRPFDQEGDHR